jgi:hypothetical protein
MKEQWIFIITPILLVTAVLAMAMQQQVIIEIEGMSCSL